MNERERLLSILVGGLAVAAGIWWGLGRYNEAKQKRDKQIANKEFELEQMFEQQLLGERANWQMGEYVLRSLPADIGKAKQIYGAWLLELSNESGLNNVSVDPLTARRQGELFNEISFRVSGRAKMGEMIEWMHAFYAKDTLHRIRNLSVKPARNADQVFTVEMTIDAISLNSTPSDLPPRDSKSFMLTGELDGYREKILDRNLFEPPNQAPRYTGRQTLEAVAGRETTVPLTFRDPEDQTLVYELVQGPEDLPFRVDESKGTLRVGRVEEGEYEIRVRAEDSGRPKRSIETTLVVKAEPPPPPEPEPEKPLKFDDAKQTKLTGLVRGKDEWVAWLHVLTRDEMLRLRKDDAFEVGSVKGKIVDVTPRQIEIDVNGETFTMKLDELLREVVPESATPKRDADDAAEGKDGEGPKDEPEASDKPSGEKADPKGEAEKDSDETAPKPGVAPVPANQVPPGEITSTSSTGPAGGSAGLNSVVAPGGPVTLQFSNQAAPAAANEGSSPRP